MKLLQQFLLRKLSGDSRLTPLTHRFPEGKKKKNNSWENNWEPETAVGRDIWLGDITRRVIDVDTFPVTTQNQQSHF